MGAWGHEIREDDFVCDVIGDFEGLLKAGSRVEDASKVVRAKFAARLEDSDESPLFWIALAEVQWTYGQVDTDVLNHVKDDLESGRSLVFWKDDGLARRKAALEDFIRKISTANPRPKDRPKVVIQAPKFQPGDCLSIRLPNGQYGAALVLAADHTNLEHGMNLIGTLNYLSSESPSIEVFQERNWLVLTHHNWKNEMVLAWYGHEGFQWVEGRLEMIGQVRLLESDPKNSNSFGGWDRFSEQVVRQREWDGNPVD